MRSKSKLFELLALKEKLERNKHYKQAKAINEEIQKNKTLKEKLQEITKQEKETKNSITAIQLKSKNWYGLKIQEQILASENKDLFLQKENFQIQKKIAHKHYKIKNSLEKASLHKKIEQEVAEKKRLFSVPVNNKSSVK